MGKRGLCRAPNKRASSCSVVRAGGLAEGICAISATSGATTDVSFTVTVTSDTGYVAAAAVIYLEVAGATLGRRKQF